MVPDSTSLPTTSSRLGYVDTLKGLVVAGVIVAHAGITYAAVGDWPYRELLVPSVPSAVVLAFAGAATLGMAALFLVAGLLAPAALAKKGTARFLGERVRRLGPPIAAYFLVVVPALHFLGQWAMGRPPAAAAGAALDRMRIGDLGATWFLLALLVVTVFHVGWRWVGAPPLGRGAVGVRHLVAIAALMAAGSFLVRLLQPIDSPLPLNVAAWPGYVALYAVGVAGARSGWLDGVPARLARTGLAMAIAGIAWVGFVALGWRVPVGSLAGGWGWPALALAMGESLFVVGLPVWAFRLLQRWGPAPLHRYSRSSFGAYLLQTPVVVLLGIALRPVELPAAVKFGILGGLGLVLCFGLAAWHRNRGRASSAMRPRRPLPATSP